MLASGAKSTTQTFVEITRQHIVKAARTSNAVLFGDNAQSGLAGDLKLHHLAEKARDGG